MNPSSAEPPRAESAAARERLVSLDAFRGFTMFWLLGGKALVVALAGVAGLGFVPYQLSHSEWEGVRYYDLIWPSFMLMVGVAVPFSVSRRALQQSRAERWRAAWTRAAILFLLGSLRESVSEGVPRLIELSSALQPIAVAYLVAFHLAECSRRVQAGVAAGLLAGYAALLAWVPAPGIPAGTYEINRNVVTWFDQAVIGRAHRDGWGTVLSTLPTLSTTLLGLLLGHMLRGTATPARKAVTIALTGAGCLLAGFALSPLVPVIMKLWTVSYGLITAGWSCLLFAGFFWVIDVRGWRRWTFPLVVIGAHALVAYVLPTVVPLRRIVAIFTAPVAPLAGPLAPVVTPAAVVLAGWLVLHWLHRHRIVRKG